MLVASNYFIPNNKEMAISINYLLIMIFDLYLVNTLWVVVSTVYAMAVFISRIFDPTRILHIHKFVYVLYR